jgi:regulator of sigma E protease
MFTTLISIAGVIITIVLIVGIHELGHFLVAKWVGIKVLRFSIGFGKPLWRCHDKTGTEYVLSAIPLGGYVKMLDKNDENISPKELHLTYNHQPFYKKFAVVAAGPLSNIVFAFLIYWLLFMVGFTSINPIIGKIIPHSIAEQAGLKPQEEITFIDGKPTHTWMSVVIHMTARSGDTNTLQIQVKDLKTQQKSLYSLDLAHWHMDSLRPDPLTSLGIQPYEPIIPATIGRMSPNSPAAKAGLKIGDTILSVNGLPIYDWFTLTEMISSYPGKTLAFIIKRQYQVFGLAVPISYTRDLLLKKHGYLGIAPNFEWPVNLLHQNKYGPLTALPHAWQNTVLFTNLNFIMLGKILTGKISLKSLGGPITIFENAGTALNNGFVSFLGFLAFLSISIGVINILPIPGLDGGHLLFESIEAITRRPISPQFQSLLLRLGFIFLLIVMAQAIINDILRF